jgi:hypothetical protein
MIPTNSPTEAEDPKFLPLEVFDDTANEEFSVDELMKDPVAYSKFSDVSDQKVEWKKCRVLNCDEHT